MKTNQNKVLVIGASGSLGKAIALKLDEQHDVVGTYCTRKIKSNIKTAQVDITNKGSLDALEKGFNTVVFIAGAMPAEMKGYSPQHYIDVNITGAQNVLEFCVKRNIRKVIYVTTFSDVSGAFYTGEPIKDDDPRTLTYTGDHAFYGITKVTACELLEHYHQEFGLQTIIFRIPTVYCNDTNFNYYVDGELKTKAYVQMIQSIVNKGEVEIWGNPENAKDMPYVKDFGNLINKAVNDNHAQGIYNAGTANPVSLENLVDNMIAVFGEGKNIKKIYKPDHRSQPNFTFNMDKTFQQFDFKVEFGIKNLLLDIKDSIGLDAFKSPIQPNTHND